MLELLAIHPRNWTEFSRIKGVCWWNFISKVIIFWKYPRLGCYI